MIAAIGVPVVAVVNGTVSHRDNAVGGLSAFLIADNGDYYFYTHLSAYGAGGRVAQGTVIGYVGMTGNATIPHLHFEYHPGGFGNPVNPYPVVRPHC